MRSSGKRARFSVIALALALLASLVVAELIARRVSPTYRRMHDPPHAFIKPNPERGWAMVPGYRGQPWGVDFRVNSLGFRGPEITRPKPAGTFRVIVLGDSIVLGSGLPENALISSRLEEMLEALRPGAHAQVINAGMPGYDVEQERMLLSEQGPALDPDAVVLIACLNDVPNVSIADLVNPLRDLAVPGKVWLTNLSALALMVQALYESIGIKHGSRLADLFSAERDPATTARIEKGWREYESALGAMARDCRARRIPFIVVLVPHAAQFEDTRHRFIPQHRLAAICQKLDVPFLDLAPSFSSLPSLPYILPDPVHLSPQGHQIMAQEINRALEPFLPHP